MRGNVGIAACIFAAAAVLFTPSACTPVQWNFVFSEDIPDPGATPPANEIIIAAAELDAGDFTFAYDLGAQDGIEDGAEVYLTSLSFWITPLSTEADFSSFTSIQVTIEPQSGGTPVVIAHLDPGDPQFQPGVTSIDLITEDVDLTDFVSVDHTITLTVTGSGPAAELRFAGQAIFSGSAAL